MSSDNPAGPTLTKREFLQGFAAVGGVSATLAAMNAWGVGIDSLVNAPPSMTGSANGKKVLILGSGLAGMTAAYELSQRGYDCRILEARSFAGGRCQTARAGFEFSELTGNKQVCEFEDGHYFNHGPWRIPSQHQSILYYCKEFGIPLEILVKDNDEAYVRFDNKGGPLNGKIVRRREVMADMRGYTAELLAKQVDQGKLDETLDEEARELLIEYLVHEGFLQRDDLAYRGTTERGYEIHPGAGTDPGPGVPSKAYEFKDLLQSGLGRIFRGVSSVERPYTMFQPVGGMDVLARAFSDRIGDSIVNNVEVQEIRQDGDGVRIPVKDTRTGEVREETADYCISTIPPTLVSRMPADLSDECKAALKAPTGSPVGKLALQMNRRFWEEDDGIYGGSSVTDLDGAGSVIYPSYGWQGKTGVVQGYYNFRNSAIKVSALSLEKRADLGLQNGELVHPGRFREHYDGNSFSVAWHLVQYSMGGWESWSADARKTHYPVLLEPQGRVVFAGTYLSHLAGWQAGAVESAWQQIEKLHQIASTS